MSRQLDFFTETAVTPEQKVEIRSQGGKLTVIVRAKNGSLTKIGVVWQKSDSPCSGHDWKKLFKENNSERPVDALAVKK